MRHPEPSLLYHYTCEHGATGILRDGIIKGNVNLAMSHGALFVWLTDMPIPNKHALGLANLAGLVTCDRTAHRFTVPADLAIWYPAARRELMAANVPLDALERSPGVRPVHWFVQGGQCDHLIDYQPRPGVPSIA